MSNTIDILTVVDAASIEAAVAAGTLSSGGTITSPVSLGAWSQSDAYIYMITQTAFVVNEEAQSELSVKANVGDAVRWMITCPGGGTSYNVVLMGMNFNPSTAISPFSLPLNLNLYVGSPTVPVKPVAFTDYSYEGVVTATGSIQYTITFQLLDNNGNNLGFYFWDPFIVVSN